jgi:hypothetical protein
MAAANKKLLAVVLAGLVLGGGFIVVWQTVLAPREERQLVRGEVRAYLEAWRDLRACIVGDQPRSQGGREALTARALLEGDLEPALRRCDEPARALTRTTREFAGDAVEARWTETLKAGKKVLESQAMAGHATKARKVGAGYSDTTLRRALGDAVDALDVAVAALAREVDLAVEPPPGPALAAPAARPITATDGTPLQPFQPIARGDVVLDRPAFGAGALLYRQTGPDAIERMAIGADITIAATGGFGMWVDAEPSPRSASGEISILKVAPLDEQGEPVDDGVEVARSTSGILIPRFAVAAGAVQLVAYMETEPGAFRRDWHLARSRDGGKTWPERVPVRLPEVQAVEDYARGRLDLFGPPGERRGWLSVRPEVLDGALAVTHLDGPPAAEGIVTRACTSGPLLFMPTEDLLWRLAADQPPTPVAGVLPATAIVACDGERILALDPEAGELIAERCDGPRCRTFAPVPQPAGAVSHGALTADAAALAVSLDEIVVLWRGVADGPSLTPSVHRLPPGCEVAGLASWPDGPVAVLSCEETTSLLPLR